MKKETLPLVISFYLKFNYRMVTLRFTFNSEVTYSASNVGSDANQLADEQPRQL